jgi:mannose/fructose/N-acetylgalactosamine-specific phosphotransferase system component IIB
MPVSLIRIDDRLIHGQVVVGWVAATRANCVVVVNDAVAGNEMQKCLMQMAVPPHLQVRICSVDGFDTQTGCGGTEENNVILLVTNPGDLLRLREKGFVFDAVNLGGMRHAEKKKEYSRSIFLDEKDISDFVKLKELGVKVEVRMVPSDKPVDLFECLHKGHCELEEKQT